MLLIALDGVGEEQPRERVRTALGDLPDQLGVTPLVLRLLNREAEGAGSRTLPSGDDRRHR